MGERSKDALRVNFDRKLKLEFHGTKHEIPGSDNTVPVVITTHPTQQSRVTAARRGLNKLNTVCSRPACIRIVDIPEDKD